MTPARIAEIRARLEAEADDESGSVKEQQARKDRADLLASHDALQAEVERLRKGLTAVAVAAAEGRVCDDVVWFDDIQTLHDFCMEAADPGGDKTAYDILTTARTDAAQRMRERCVEVCDRHGRIAAIEAASAIRALPLEES